MTKVIVTADDLGISTEINYAIEECHRKGILSSSALLVNAPYTRQGIEIAKRLPDLEVGLHLSIVEGLSLRRQRCSITDPEDYFDGICLIRNWKSFVKKYYTRRINFQELEDELELQIQEFLKHFDHIPFINGTQHMHLLPKVWSIVRRLILKYHIKAVRLPSLEFPNRHYANNRLIPLLVFNSLGQLGKFSLRKSIVKSTDKVVGMQYSGKISKEVLVDIIGSLPADASVEIVMHPGYESLTLRNRLPWSYSDFNWDIERNALLSDELKSIVQEKNIRIIQFSDL
jgi:predicted glycoside hydrolase/deacetylase ChbG (UPF0249 family)